MSQSSEDEDDDFMDGESDEEAESLVDEEDEEDDFQQKKPTNKSAKRTTPTDNVANPGQAAASKKSKQSETPMQAPVPKAPARKPASNAQAQPVPSSAPVRTPASKTAPSSTPVNTPAAKTEPPSTAPKMAIGGVEQTVCEYLLVQNRPYNAIQITENLRKTIPKSHIDKVLDALSAKGTLVCKEVGKQKIYYPNQEQFDTPDEDTMRIMLDTANRKNEEAKWLRRENEASRSEVKSLENELDDDSLSAKIEELEAETVQLRSRLADIQGTGQGCTVLDKEKISKQYTEIRTQWRKRKRQVMDGINQMCDSMETMRPKDLMEKMGIELDEEWKVQLGDEKIGPKRRK